MSLSLKEQYDEYARQMMRCHALNTLIAIEMGYIDPEYARFSSDLEKAAKKNPVIGVRLALTTMERVIGLRKIKQDSFEPEELMSRAEQIATNSVETGQVLREFDRTCQRKYLTAP